MSDLPAGWAKATLDDIAAPEPRAITDGPFGSNLKTAHYTTDGPRVIRLQNIGDGYFVDGEAHISDSHFEKLKAHSVAPGDLLIAGLGQRLPRACIAPVNLGPAIVKADCFRVRLYEDISSDFVCAMLNSPQMRDAASQKISGIGRPRLNLAKVRRLTIPLPPAAEQKRIVAAIEEQFSRIDAGDAALARVRRNLDRMRAALLWAAMTGNLAAASPIDDDVLISADSQRRERWAVYTSKKYPEPKPPSMASMASIAFPSHWKVASLEAVTDAARTICYGILMPRVRDGGEIPYVEVKDLRGRILDPTSLHKTSKELHSEFVRSELAPGDVLLAIRGSFDRALAVPPSLAGANISRDVARIAPLAMLNADFLASYLTSPISLRYLRDRAKGVAVKGVNIADIKTMPVPIPPLEEQAEIVAALRLHNSLIDAAEDRVRVAALRSRLMRSSVLDAAFSGQLAAQDPSEEPASKLLQRSASELIS
jgi:type I restriction enzyme, S subunit